MKIGYPGEGRQAGALQESTMGLILSYLSTLKRSLKTQTYTF